MIMLAQGVGSLATRTLAGNLTDKIGARWVVVAGTVVAALATIPFALFGDATPWWILVISLFVRGAGLSGLLIPAMSVAYKDVPAEKIASSTIITRTIQQVGGAFGVAAVAVAVSWFSSRLSLGDAYHAAFWIVFAFTALTCLSAFRLPTASGTKSPSDH